MAKKLKSVSVRVSEDQEDLISKVAASAGRTKSSLVRGAILNFLRDGEDVAILLLQKIDDEPIQ